MTPDGSVVFNDCQREAIEHETGPMEVMAGPGTGKTTLMVERQARLIEKRRAWKYEFLCLAFTRRDVAHMRESLQVRLDEDVNKLPIFTFHAFCKHLLSNERSAKKDGGKLRILDPAAAYRVLRRAMADVEVDERAWSPRLVMELITEVKELSIGPDEFLTVPDSAAQQTVAKIYQRYQGRLDDEDALDFSDLIMETAELLETNPELQAKLHEQHRFIQVDEWQDTSVGQYRLLRLLTGPDANLFVVGSEAQSIYEWRQANYTKLSRMFHADFPTLKLVVLQENHRSTAPIVKASAALFHGQYRDVKLTAMRGAGEKVHDVRVLTEYDEAQYVALEAKRLKTEYGMEWRDMAILYRTNDQSRIVQEEFIHHRIPYTLMQGQRLYHRREIRDILAYLTLVQNDDPLSMSQIINTPPRGLGPVSLRALKGDSPFITWDHLFRAMAEGDALKLRPQAVQAISQFYDLCMELMSHKTTPPAQLIDLILDKTGYRAWLLDELDGEERLKGILMLQAEAQEYTSTAKFLDDIQVKLTTDVEHAEDEGLNLSTIHAVKGLQFAIVFIIGMEEGLLPNAKSGREEEGERRLFYVAMTRAKDRLYLISAGSRERTGRRSERRPSRYLADMPIDLVVRERLGSRVYH